MASVIDAKKRLSQLEEQRKALGTFLKDTRVHAGLSQMDVAKKLGFATPQFVSNWENGRSSPPMKHVDKICLIYSFDVDKFCELLAEHSCCQAELKTRQELEKIVLKKAP